jgi:outer membrane protein assembly factor BamB
MRSGKSPCWRAAVGNGFSSFAVVDDRVYTLGNTDNTDTVFCFDADTGDILWRHSYPCNLQPASYEGGPGSTPAVDGTHLFVFSKGGDLFCLHTATGETVWSKKFPPWPYLPGDWVNTWRYAGSPLLYQERLIMSVGQAGLSLNKTDGDVIWESAAGHPGYSSPVPFPTQQGQAVVFFSGHAVVGAMASSGHQLWQLPWNTEWDLNATDPIIHDGKMFVSSGNGVGCALFDITADPPVELWRNKRIKNLMNSSIYWQGNVFGFNETHLACISWETRRIELDDAGATQGIFDPGGRKAHSAGPRRSWPEATSIFATRRGESSRSMCEQAKVIQHQAIRMNDQPKSLDSFFKPKGR